MKQSNNRHSSRWLTTCSSFLQRFFFFLFLFLPFHSLFASWYLLAFFSLNLVVLPKMGETVELFPPHMYTLPYIQKQFCQCFPTPVHTAIHTKAVLPVFPHTWTHCHTCIQRQCFPTPVHTVIHTKTVLPACPHTYRHCHTYKSSVASVSPHLYTLSYYQHFPTPVHTVTHTKAVLPVFLHISTHCHTNKNSVVMPFQNQKNLIWQPFKIRNFWCDNLLK